MKQKLLIIFLLIFASPAFNVGATTNPINILSTNSIVEDDFTLLTNPVRDGVLKLRVNNNSLKNVSITVINSLGDKVYDSKSIINRSVIDFDISKLATGIYFLRIQSNERSAVKKLIVQ